MPVRVLFPDQPYGGTSSSSGGVAKATRVRPNRMLGSKWQGRQIKLPLGVEPRRPSMSADRPVSIEWRHSRLNPRQHHPAWQRAYGSTETAPVDARTSRTVEHAPAASYDTPGSSRRNLR